MSAQLDKSLDEIISANKPKKALKRGNNKTNKVGKQQQPVKKAPKKQAAVAKPARPARPTGPATVQNSVIATKAIVYNLPKDIKQEDIKEFFQSQVGHVKGVALSYNEKGQSKGIATILFAKASSATAAFEKFNGAPIDNGSNKLRVELVYDPTKKPLSSRITINPVAAAVVAAKKGKKATPAKPTAVVAATKKSTPKKKAAKPAKKVKKTVEDLDKEMADYFETK